MRTHEYGELTAPEAALAAIVELSKELAPETPTPDTDTLALLRGPVAEAVAERYPAFAERVFGKAAA